MILDLLVKYAITQAEFRIVTDARIGLSYTAILLDNGSVGTAMTFRHEIPGACLSGKEPLIGQKAVALIANVNSADLLERTIALATINAVINHQKRGIKGGDILEHLYLKKTDTVGMVGHFAPLIPALKRKVDKLLIFEKNHQKTENLYTDQDTYKMLPACSVAIITSTSLINLSLENLVNVTANCRKVALVGASTPLAPEVFRPFGINCLSGIIVTNPTEILRIVSEGGGMKSFKGSIEKVNVSI